MPTADRYALAVAEVRRGRTVWLVVSTRDGRWTLPKGRSEGDERPLQAAVRETEEEAGVRARPLTETPVTFTHVTGRGRTQRVAAFPAVRLGRGEPALHDRWRSRRWTTADDPRLPGELRAALTNLEVAHALAA